MADSTYLGPSAGSTPAGDNDLHESSNPFNTAGSPSVDNMASPEYRNDVPGYYTNPPTSPSGNPYSANSAPSRSESGDRTAADYIAAGMDASLSQVYNYQAGGDAPATSASSDAYWVDGGFGSNGLGRS